MLSASGTVLVLGFAGEVGVVFVIREITSNEHPRLRRLAVDERHRAIVEGMVLNTSVGIDVYLLTVDGRQIPFEARGDGQADPVRGALYDLVAVGAGFIPRERGVKPDLLEGPADRRKCALLAAEGLIALRSYRPIGVPAAWPQRVKYEDEIYDWPEYANGRTTREP